MPEFGATFNVAFMKGIYRQSSKSGPDLGEGAWGAGFPMVEL